jgi:hypothetical protein
MSSEDWLPNDKHYENTNSRLWFHILRNTPKDAKILIVTTKYQERIYNTSKTQFDLEQREITFETYCIRGVNPERYDFILFLSATKKDIEIMLTLAMCPSSCKILYREIVSPMRGERFINIENHWALSSIE